MITHWTFCEIMTLHSSYMEFNNIFSHTAIFFFYHFSIIWDARLLFLFYFIIFYLFFQKQASMKCFKMVQLFIWTSSRFNSNPYLLGMIKILETCSELQGCGNSAQLLTKMKVGRILTGLEKIKWNARTWTLPARPIPNWKYNKAQQTKVYRYVSITS